MEASAHGLRPLANMRGAPEVPGHLQTRLNAPLRNTVTGHEAISCRDQLRGLSAAALPLEWAARMEAAALRRVDRIGDFTFHSTAHAAGHLQIRHCIEQHARVGVARVGEELV